MKQFTIGFTHSNSQLRLTEVVTAPSAQYARESLKGRYDGVRILSITENQEGAQGVESFDREFWTSA